MIKRLCVALAIVVGLARPASAQLGSVPYTFTSGTAIHSAEVNTNFSTAYANACNRTGCTMTATMTARSISAAANNTYDIGSTGTRFKDLWLAGTGTIVTLSSTTGTITTLGSTTATLTTANVTTGNITTGNITTLVVSGAGTFGSVHSIIPTTDATYDLGSSGSKFLTIYGNIVSAGTITTGIIRAAVTASYDIGEVGTTFRSLYLSGNIALGGNVVAQGNITAAGNLIAINSVLADNATLTGTGLVTTAIDTDALTVNSDVSAAGAFAGTGVYGRQGSSGGSFGQVINFWWTGSALQSWVGTTNIGNVSIASDRRLKKDIKPLEGSLDAIMRLHPSEFHFTVGDTDAHYGLMAQDVAEVLPVAAQHTTMVTPATPDGMWRVDYPSLIPVLIKAIQEQQAQIDDLRAQVRTLQAR